ncbi:hypothetical protein ZWY2020_059746 [Hordeum vulgare]|nr:hypothetical protein ZWY2020_059746 [Hordeum vulgare]
MAAKSWNPFPCCVGGSRVADNDYDDRTSRRRTGRSVKRCPRSSSRMSFKSLSSSGTLSPEDLSITLSGSNLHAFTYAELRTATGSFSRANYLGCGGFGPVYKGAVDENLRPGLAAQAVAVKYLDLDCGTQGHKEWLAEVFFLGQLRHKNLVKLIGYCYEDEHRMLVYEFMNAGSLETHLFKSTNGSLPWMTRMKIAVGAAKGLAFLHDADPPVIYRDFKASNILLDSDYNTKLSDFGLAKDGPQGDATHALEPVLGMEDFFPVGPFVFTVIVEEDKVVDMKVEVEEKHQHHRQNHQDRHRQKYPDSAIHAGIVLRRRDGLITGYNGAQGQKQRPSSYHREKGA